MSNAMKELTRAEESVMQILWVLEKAFVKDIVDKFDEPRPAYNTVSTIIRILEKKGFVSYRVYGNTYEYYPLMTKTEYSDQFIGNFIKKYFDNSYQSLVSSFAKGENLSLKELEEMKEIVENEIKRMKNNE